MTYIYQVLIKLYLRDFINVEGSCYHYQYYDIEL